MQSLGKWIRTQRKREGHSQESLAALLKERGQDFSPSTISWWEQGRTNPPVHDVTFIRALAEVFNTTDAEVLRGAGYDLPFPDNLDERQQKLLAAYERGDLQEIMRIALDKVGG